MTIRAIHDVIDPLSVLASTHGEEIDLDRTLERYSESLKNTYRESFPDAEITIEIASTGRSSIDCDTDAEYDDVGCVASDHFERGGFWVLPDGEVV